MDCLEVRTRLTEHALSLLPAEERAFVDRHLEWCAGCRKEEAQLQEAATLIGRSIPQAEPSPQVERKVVEGVRAAAGARSPGRRPFRALSAATVAAVVVALLGVGWAAVMTERARVADARWLSAQAAAREAQQQAEDLSQRLRRFLGSFLQSQKAPPGPHDLARQGQLGPTVGREGGGGAVVYTSPVRNDWALVLVGGMARNALPYRVLLRDNAGHSLLVGKIHRLDAGGGARVFREFTRHLQPYRQVVVQDRFGRPALRGTIPRASAATANAS